MTDTSELPRAIWEGTFTIGGCQLRCAVLDDGRRVISSVDLAEFLDAMRGDEFNVLPAEVEEFAKWTKGVSDGSQ